MAVDTGLYEALLPALVPIGVYWVVSGVYHVMTGSLQKHRMFTDDEADAKNLASRRQVVLGVLINQGMQIVLTISVFLLQGIGGAKAAAEATAPPPPPASLFQLVRQLAVAMLFVEPWGYFWHRLTHESKFLYKHIHSMHHRMIVPYAFGGQYIHPLDALFGDILGGYLATVVSGMSPGMSTVFITLLTLKVVDDHCGLWLPSHPVHRFLSNSSAFHAVHHQHFGIKYNYSVHFFSFWDKIMDTYLPFTLEQRKGGGYHLRAAAAAGKEE